MPDIVEFLRLLQGAIAVRQLYPPEHPRMAERLSRLAELTRDLTAEGALSIFALDGRVIHNDAPVQGGEAYAQGVFQVLRAGGFDRFTISPGVTPEELTRFVTRLSARDTRRSTGAPLPTSPHIRLSSLTAATTSTDFSTVQAASAPVLAMWAGVAERGVYDEELIQCTVSGLLNLMARHATSLVPLALTRSHDEYTAAHMTNVSMLAMTFAEALGLDAGVTRDVGIAALLHDIGKTQTPLHILNAPGRLSDADAAIMRLHPEQGARMLLATPGVPPLAVVVAFEHHLQHDGGGYPAGARRWKRNLASAMTQVCDVFDALRSDRPYRRGLPLGRVTDIMQADAGTVFEPALLRTFFQWVAPRVPDRPEETGTGADVAPPPPPTAPVSEEARSA